MSACEVGLRKLSKLPKDLFELLSEEVKSWDVENSDYNYNSVFGYHKMKSYFTGTITKNISYPSHIQPIISWLENEAGENCSVVRCFLNCIEPNTSFRLHVDTLRVHKLARRFHIPITKSEDCFYFTYTKNKDETWDEHVDTMECGFLYELDNIRPHNVKNHNGVRVNFIADVISNDMIDDKLNSCDFDQTTFLNKIFTFGLPINR